MNPLPGLLQNAAASYARLAGDESHEPSRRLRCAVQARSLFEQYLALPGHSGDTDTKTRLSALAELVRTLHPPGNVPVPPALNTPQLRRRPWFIALMVTLGSAVAAGSVAAAVVFPRGPQPPPSAQIIDASQPALTVHF